MKAHRMSHAVIVLLAMSMLAACSLSRPAPVKQSFLLNATRPAATTPAAPTHAALRINRFTVAQPADGRPIVYRATDLRYELDFYNEFLALPATMLTERTLAWLSDAQVFAAVVPMTSSLDARYVLEASAFRLGGDFRDPQAPRAVLALRTILARDDAPGNVLMDRAFEQSVPIPDRSPDAVVAGLDRALAGVLADLETQLRAVLAKAR